MTPRQPSIVPFLVLLGLAGLLALFLPAALASHNPLLGALLLLLSVLGALFALSILNLLLSFGAAKDLPQSVVVVPALWLLPLLGLAQQKNPLALLCTLPFVYSLRQHLPLRAAPWGNAFFAAIGIHLVLLLQFMDKAFLAVLLALAIASLIFWAAEDGETSRRFRILSPILAIVFGLYLFRPPALPEAGSNSAFAATAVVAKPGGSQSQEQTALQGVILRPKVEEKDYKLPPPPVLRNQEFANIPKSPFEIPFSGVYWIFQPPLPAPPDKSPIADGTPADFRFRSGDSTPIRLEARQSLRKPIPFSRIQEIGVTLLSTDRYPDTISLKLLATSSKELRMQMNLGIVRVTHMPEWNAVPQTLQFKIPPHPLLSEFDGLILRFVLEPPRLQIVPRLSVQKFVIHPR